MAQPSLYFQGVHWGNGLLARVLSFRHRIPVWHMKLPLRLGSRFEFAPPRKTLPRDEWLRQMDPCFDVWNTHVFTVQSGTVATNARCGKRDFGFRGNVTRHIGKESEDAWLLCATTGYLQQTPGKGLRVAPSWGGCSTLVQAGDKTGIDAPGPMAP